MADDDDWETDADFENNLTEVEQRAYGNAETMARYQAAMDKSGGSVPGEQLAGITQPAAPPQAPAPASTTEISMPTPVPTPPSGGVKAKAATFAPSVSPSSSEGTPTPGKLDLSRLGSPAAVPETKPLSARAGGVGGNYASKSEGT